MNTITPKEANNKPHLQYNKIQKDTPVRYIYSSCDIESPFDHEKVPPFNEWRTGGELLEAIDTEFDNLRKEFASNKRKHNSHPERKEEGLLFGPLIFIKSTKE